MNSKILHFLINSKNKLYNKYKYDIYDNIINNNFIDNNDIINKYPKIIYPNNTFIKYSFNINYFKYVKTD